MTDYRNAPDITSPANHGSRIRTLPCAIGAMLACLLAIAACAGSPAATHAVRARLVAGARTAAPPARVAGATVTATAAVPAAGSAVYCASSKDPELAARLAGDIAAARAPRSDTVAAWVADPEHDITCRYNGTVHFDAASVVKVIILGALLRVAQEQHRSLTQYEKYEAGLMMSQSDDDSATILWNEVGHGFLQHFLNLAGMSQTQLGASGYWGLTQITAHDQALLLSHLTQANGVLDDNSRRYALNLMTTAIPAQRWGVPAGAPSAVTVHVKDGWLPRATHGWRINSVGAFTFKGGWYTIVVLTTDNPAMSYGVTTVENIARVVHRDLTGSAA